MLTGKMQILKVSDILPVMLKEMGSWKQARGGKKKPTKTNNQLVYQEDHSSWMSSRNGMGHDGRSGPRLHSPLAQHPRRSDSVLSQ